MNTNEMTPLDRVIQAERNEYHECDLKVWGITVEEAAAELAQLRAKAERLDQLQEGVSEMRAAIETEFDSTIETQKNNIKQLIELIERQFDDITVLRAELQAAQERIAEQARQLDEARVIMQHFTGLKVAADRQMAYDWLAANAPQPQEQSA